MTPTAASAEASEFAGKTALVTGAAHGVGKETVALLHARGAHVVAVDLRPDVTTLQEEFPGVLAMRGDITREETAVHAVLAGQGILVVPVARTYTLDQIQEATKLSQSRRPGGKLVLVL